MIEQPIDLNQQQRPIWEVVRVEDGTMFSGAQGVVPSKLITVRLNSDLSTFTLEIPRNQFNAVTVGQRIDEQVQHELEVRGLHSQLSF